MNSRYPIPEVRPEESVQVVVHGAFFPQLAAWLDGQDFRLVELPPSEDEAASNIRTFVQVLGDRRWADAKPSSAPTEET